VAFRKLYRNFVKVKRRQWNDEIRDRLGNTKNPNVFWRTLRRFYGTQPPTNPIKVTRTIKNDLTEDEIEEVFTNIMEELDCEVSADEMTQAIKSLPLNKAPGPDLVPNSILKALPSDILTELLRIFNEGYTRGRTPESWSEAELCMIFKKGHRNLPGNYRGISLLNTVSKLFTAMISNRLKMWAEVNNKLPETQCGFRKGRSCEDKIFTLTVIVQQKLSRKGGSFSPCLWTTREPLIASLMLGSRPNCTKWALVQKLYQCYSVSTKIVSSKYGPQTVTRNLSVSRKVFYKVRSSPPCSSHYTLVT